MRTLLQVLIFGLCWLSAAQTVPSWFAKSPPLPPPGGEVIRVGTTDELLAAVDRLSAGGTILLTDGQYKLSRPVVLDQKTNIVLRGASGDPTKVTLSGKGWERGDEHDDILHIGRCEGVTIADLSFADCRSYGIKVEAERAPKDIHILNCRFRDIGVRAIKGSAAQDASVRAVKGSVRGCYFENTKVPPADWLFGGDYIAAIDMMALEDWTFSQNVFWNIKGRNGGGRAAIFIWVRSRQVVVERNLIVNCDRGVAFGNPGKSTANIGAEPLVYVSEGIIRNNFIVGGPDCGIELWYADRIKVLNNTIWRPEQNWNRGIRIGTGTSNTEIVNNLVHGAIQSEGGEAQVHHNLAGRLEGYFENSSSWNLTLTPAATGAFGRGLPLSEVTEDIRGQPRTGNPDLGAWQSESQRSPARFRSGKMPVVTQPVLFNTPQADEILSALEVFPPDNSFNQAIENWPLQPNSQSIVASIGRDKPLRYNTDMGFVLVPPDQPRVPVNILEYPDESDPGPFPVPDNIPIEGWPVWYQRESVTRPSLAEVQRRPERYEADRHAIIVDPVNRMLYEFFTFGKTRDGWAAGQASVFDLKSNALRPAGWTSADAAGLPIFPAVVRYDEIRRGLVEHAMRVTVRRTRRAYVHPATHFASRLDDEDLPRMGERLRLRADFDLAGFSPPVQAILKGLKKYGMFVADNGIDWAISVTPDPRISVLHEELRKIKGADFEVVGAPN
jgi:Right handed beta helix region